MNKPARSTQVKNDMPKELSTKLRIKKEAKSSGKKLTSTELFESRSVKVTGCSGMTFKFGKGNTWLSNMHTCDRCDAIDGLPTVEHYYQNKKLTEMGYPGLITADMTAVEAKRQECSKVRAREIAVQDWNKVSHKSHGWMREGLELKFNEPSLCDKLLATHPSLLGETRGRGYSEWTIQADGRPGLLGDMIMEIRSRAKEV